MLKGYVVGLLLPILLYANQYTICTIKRFDAAIATKQIEKILDKEPENVTCLIQLANIYLKKGKLAKGFQILTDAYGIDSSIVKNSEIAKIIPFALQVTKLRDAAMKTNNFLYWNQLADGYNELSILDEAIIGYEKSLKINPIQNTIRLKLAFAYRKNGRIYSCIHELKTVLSHDKNNFYATYYLGRILKEDLKNSQEALKYFKRADALLDAYKKDMKPDNYLRFKHNISKELQ
ncbi:tetratricopeptide repeat protein [Sulfurospirillum sp. 1612]|uniref:tetratricopeptide repeat protein n=1 Tax=Sulfurospirillum sp. 1612 TaxID=3094835 RepID=UPI002F92C778